MSEPIEGEVFPPEEDDHEVNKGGHPEHEATQKLRDTVETLAVGGSKQSAIAAYIGVSRTTLRRHYSKQLLYGDAKVQAMIGQALVEEGCGAPAQYYPPGHVHEGKLMRAEKPRNTAILIFLGKVRLGLRETVNLGLSDGLDDGLEYNVAGITNAERSSRLAALLNTARDRRDGRAAGGAGPVGAVQGEPPGSSLQKRG